MTAPTATIIEALEHPDLWRRWLGAESRCVVPLTSFAEHEVLPDGSRPPVWFPFDETPARLFRRHLDAVDVGSEDQGRRNDE